MHTTEVVGKNFLEDLEGEGVEEAETRLQEIGPRFCLKLRWIQVGTFDTLHGEYEWVHKRKILDTTRRRFHL